MKGFFVLVIIVLCTGCYTQKIEEAFEDDFVAADSNKIINDYCKSCHIHRDFDPMGHAEEKALLYKRKVFRYATECRTCHFLEKQFSLNDFTRKTRRPNEANRGQYKEFELEYLKSQRARQK